MIKKNEGLPPGMEMRSLPPYLNAAIHVLGVFYLDQFLQDIKGGNPQDSRGTQSLKGGETKSDVDLHFRSSSP